MSTSRRKFSKEFKSKVVLEALKERITPKNKQSVVFLKKLLSKLNDVKGIEIVEEKEEVPFVLKLSNTRN